MNNSFPSGHVLSSTGSELNWIDAAGGLKVASSRLTSDFVTTQTSYQTALSATITPTRTDSSILVVITGSGRGYYGGTGGSQQTTGYVTTYKNNSPFLGLDIFLNKGNPTFYTPISHSILDNSNHGGNAVSYQIMLRRYTGGSNNVRVKLTTAINLFEVMT